MNKINKVKTRNWFLVTYAKPEDFKPLLEECNKWAYIYHDRDKKEPHYHIIAIFKNARYFNGIKELIQSTQNTLGEPIKTTIDQCYTYLTHSEEEDKVIYEEKEIVKSENFTIKEEKKDNITEILEDIINGETLRTLAIKYGKDFVKNVHKYIQYAEMMLRQENGTVFRYQTIKDDLEFEYYVQSEQKMPDMQLNFDNYIDK